MGASGKMDAEIPPDAGEQSLRLKLRPAVRVLACYSVVGVTSVANSSFMCTWSITSADRGGLTSCPGQKLPLHWGPLTITERVGFYSRFVMNLVVNWR